MALKRGKPVSILPDQVPAIHGLDSMCDLVARGKGENRICASGFQSAEMALKSQWVRGCEGNPRPDAPPRDCSRCEAGFHGDLRGEAVVDGVAVEVQNAGAMNPRERAQHRRLVGPTIGEYHLGDGHALRLGKMPGHGNLSWRQPGLACEGSAQPVAKIGAIGGRRYRIR